MYLIFLQHLFKARHALWCVPDCNTACMTGFPFLCRSGTGVGPPQSLFWKRLVKFKERWWQNKIVTIILFLWGGGGQYLDETLDKQEDFRVGIELHWLVHWSSFYAAIHLKPYWRVQDRGGAIRGTPPPLDDLILKKVEKGEKKFKIRDPPPPLNKPLSPTTYLFRLAIYLCGMAIFKHPCQCIFYK